MWAWPLFMMLGPVKRFWTSSKNLDPKVASPRTFRPDLRRRPRQGFASLAALGDTFRYTTNCLLNVRVESIPGQERLLNHCLQATSYRRPLASLAMLHSSKWCEDRP